MAASLLLINFILVSVSADPVDQLESIEPKLSANVSERKRGKCKWFNVLKGYGFLTPDDGSEDVFVHQSVLKMPGFRSLETDEVIEFEAKKSDRGWEATIVSGPKSSDCKGSTVRPLGKKKYKKIRCFNCGEYGNHLAAKCKLAPIDKVCYQCKSPDHLISDCPDRTRNRPNSEPNQNREEESNDHPSHKSLKDKDAE